MNAVNRFLRYVRYDTQSAMDTGTTPSTAKQKVLGAALAEELAELGLYNAHMDQYGYVYGWLPATAGCEGIPCVGLIAHMDTSPAVSGADVKAKIVRYDGGDICLNKEKDLWLREKDHESLSKYRGQELIVTDGTTLLGADDKAGVAEIISAVDYLIQHPEIPHGRIAVGFTPDEEIGDGADHFDVEGFGATAAYTVDGGELGEIEYENFNAASAKVRFHGLSIHPGSAKGKMKNAALMALEFAAQLPPQETPAHTEGYEGFFHLEGLNGDPASAVMSYIIRDHDMDRFQARKARLEQAVQDVRSAHPKAQIQLELRDSYHNMAGQLKDCMHLIDNAREAARLAGVESFTNPIRGGTDGARLSYMGLPCPNLGTGGFNFHGPYECISVEGMDSAVAILRNIVALYAEAR